MSIKIEEQIAELKRELAIREKVYPRWIISGRLKRKQADIVIARMKAALHTLIELSEAQSAGIVPPIFKNLARDREEPGLP